MPGLPLQLNWHQCQTRAAEIAHKILAKSPVNEEIRLYGVPRGGIIPALLVKQEIDRLGHACELVPRAIEASYAIDDVIETGNTMENVLSKLPNQNFYALMDKRMRPDDQRWIVFPWEIGGESLGPTENIVRLLEFIGENPKRNGLLETPKRVIKSYGELFSGYKQDPKDIFTVFDDKCDEMVVLRNIEFYSMCEHHMLPFHGVAHIGYIPTDKVVGISKLARLLDIFAKRLQVQERLTQEITAALMEHLNPLGAACMIKAKHMCMCSRGVNKQGTEMVTSSLLGVFKELPATRAEFYQLVGG